MTSRGLSPEPQLASLNPFVQVEALGLVVSWPLQRQGALCCCLILPGRALCLGLLCVCPGLLFLWGPCPGATGLTPSSHVADLSALRIVGVKVLQRGQGVLAAPEPSSRR